MIDRMIGVSLLKWTKIRKRNYILIRKIIINVDALVIKTLFLILFRKHNKFVNLYLDSE